jgi:hypothetical protein
VVKLRRRSVVGGNSSGVAPFAFIAKHSVSSPTTDIRLQFRSRTVFHVGEFGPGKVAGRAHFLRRVNKSSRRSKVASAGKTDPDGSGGATGFARQISEVFRSFRSFRSFGANTFSSVPASFLS